MVIAITETATEGNLQQYLCDINRFPLLSERKELELARRWRVEEDWRWASAIAVNAGRRLSTPRGSRTQSRSIRAQLNRTIEMASSEENPT
jgi:hypothetical protein